MRSRNTDRKNPLSVHAVAGTAVVLLGLDIAPKAAAGLLGFSVGRSGGGKKKWLGGGRVFPGTPADRRTDSRTAPIQGFLWSDYEAAPKTTYEYTVTALYGDPAAPRPGATATVKVTTQDPDSARHGVYFNRGVAGSQSYSRQFQDYRRYYKVEKMGRATWEDFIRPEGVPDGGAYKWLSRGLEEGFQRFVRQATGEGYALRAAVYEFNHLPAVAEFAAALERGADVRVVYHAKQGTRQVLKRGQPVAEDVIDPITLATRSALARVGLRAKEHTGPWDAAFTPRVDTTISHNKFVVLLKDGEPQQVWTGSTNFTAGGIYGQSNVGHVVRDPAVAKRYLDYWTHLQTDPPRKGIQGWNVAQQPDLDGAPGEDSVTTIFSPRPTTAMLSWYADRMAEAKKSVHFTAAFGVSQQMAAQLMTPGGAEAAESFQRYVLLEGLPPKRQSETRKEAARKAGKPVPLDYYDIKDQARNRIAWGDVLRSASGRQLAESLTGLNTNVDFLHTKYLLVDPLGADPLVVTGSANFSDNSTTMNDENMLVVRGDTELADAYLTEFMRLFNHFSNRNRSNAGQKKGAPREEVFLDTDDRWTEKYLTPGEPEYRERLLFS